MCVCLYLAVDIVFELVCISETMQIIENGKWLGNMDIHEDRHIMDKYFLIAYIFIIHHSDHSVYLGSYHLEMCVPPSLSNPQFTYMHRPTDILVLSLPYTQLTSPLLLSLLVLEIIFKALDFAERMEVVLLKLRKKKVKCVLQN